MHNVFPDMAYELMPYVTDKYYGVVFVYLSFYIGTKPGKAAVVLEMPNGLIVLVNIFTTLL